MNLPTYSGLRTFLRAPTQVEGEADVVVFGVPFDIGTTNRPGARFGPEAVRAASLMFMEDDHPSLRVTPGEGLTLVDRGDLEIVNGYLEASLEAIEKQVSAIRGHALAIGGDHTISLPLLRALRKRRGAPLSLVHFDAHVDTWDDNYGGPLGHGTPFFHALREDLIDPRTSVQIGIRSPVSNHLVDEGREKGFTILSAEDVHVAGPEAIAKKIQECVGDRAAYLTFDIDGLDPSCAPGTGTPVPGGLFTWQVEAILRRLAGIDWVGMDLVEIAPAYDHAQITALAGAHIAWTYLGLLSVRRGAAS
jgi:agmatinase